MLKNLLFIVLLFLCVKALPQTKKINWHWKGAQPEKRSEY